MKVYTLISFYQSYEEHVDWLFDTVASAAEFIRAEFQDNDCYSNIAKFFNDTEWTLVEWETNTQIKTIIEPRF